MATPKLKAYLNTLSKEELIKHIVELDKKFKPVQDYYQLFVNNDVSGTVKKFRDTIENEFFPARGLPKMRLSVARSAVSNAKKTGLPPEELASLMLFYVETGVEFTHAYGDINEAFYSSMESMFAHALKYMYSERMLPVFENRAALILHKTADTGWGFHDCLSGIFYEYYD